MAPKVRVVAETAHSSSHASPEPEPEPEDLIFREFAYEVIEEWCVDFRTTTDPESLEILKMLKECGLKTYCSASADSILIDGALKFLYNLRDHDGVLYSEVQGEHLEITDDDLQRIFRLPAPTDRIMPDVYRTRQERAILDFLLCPADAHHTKGFKKPMLKRKFRLLFDIVQKVIVGITYSLDAVTQDKVRIMAAIIDNAKIDWQGFQQSSWWKTPK